MFEVTIEHAGPATLVVRVAGEIDFGVVAVLELPLLQAVAADGVRRVVVDLGAVRFMDSSGVHALMRGYDAAIALQRSLTVRNATGVVVRVLRLLGVAEILGLAGNDGAERPLTGT
jgi:anti-sigma B factor antagonist